MRGFEQRDGMLCVGGYSLAQIAVLAGGVPFFAYDRRLIADRVAQLRAVLPHGVSLSYSIKSNPMPALVQHMAGLVDALDVSSVAELRLALNAGIAGNAVQFSGPGKSADELAAAVAAGVVLSIESAGELEAVCACPGKPRIVLRVNPDFSVLRSGMRMGSGPSQFGIDADAVPGLVDRALSAGLDLRGFHIYWGSQNLHAEAIVAAYEGALRLARQYGAALPVMELHLGAGLGIPYSDRQSSLDIGQVGAGLARLLRDTDPRSLRVTLESGRYLVGEAGIYVCRVLDRKLSRGRVFLVTDGGMHHHLAATGNFGRAQLGSFPIAIGNRIGAEPQEEVAISGRLCTPLDRFADHVLLPRSEPGDFVVVFQSGAYARSASPAQFISHPHSVEFLL